MSRDQNVGRNNNITIDNSSFERMEEFKYLEKTLTNQNSIQEEIKSSLMLAIIRCTIFCLLVCYPKIERLRCTKL
jgi:flagellar biosynthesis/type III secretory pathway M-ring protein FliF/YscJ